MDERGGEMEKEVKPYYEDDYQSLDEVDTADLLEKKLKNPSKKTSKIGRFILELRRKNNGWQ
jgi:hypothetical protein